MFLHPHKLGEFLELPASTGDGLVGDRAVQTVHVRLPAPFCDL